VPGPPPNTEPIWSGRVAPALVALGAGALLAVASGLQPSTKGHGTHESLGMPACAWAVNLDRPCPTCGMTTSFAHAAEGDLGAALVNQPMGAVLAVLAATVLIGAGHAALTGARVGSMLGPVASGRTLWIAGGLTLGAWVYKIITWTG